MKKIGIVAVVVMIVAALSGSALAANSLNQGTIGVSAGFAGDEAMISAKYFVAKDMALIAGFGLTNVSGDGETGTDIALQAGIRKYLKVDDFAPFVEGYLKYDDRKLTVLNPVETRTISAVFAFGAEYFLHKQFSIEGAVGAALRQIDTKTAAGTETNTVLTTETAAVRANFYFK